MTLGLESITTQTLSLALDVAAARQQVLAANIANANTPGYVPQRLSFEAQLEGARRELQAHGTLGARSMSSLHLQLQPVLNAQGESESVQLDVEMAEMARNAVQYQALAKGLSRHFSILSSAVNDGKK